ncbi:MAG: hypothetical protein H0Z19_06785 [Archaeoglobus sp.]|uniref:hypothetical protein n=1 Tax=Archaeoglobus sp. TaxID=1872626 RepID=UPI001D487BD2|nr:hypothetical protein [Archaeoglobus sp.]MBO8180173.1 hypothetical protein [Archaeoglobus sp.]
MAGTKNWGQNRAVSAAYLQVEESSGCSFRLGNLCGTSLSDHQEPSKLLEVEKSLSPLQIEIKAIQKDQAIWNTYQITFPALHRKQRGGSIEFCSFKNESSLKAGKANAGDYKLTPPKQPGKRFVLRYYPSVHLLALFHHFSSINSSKNTSTSHFYLSTRNKGGRLK